MIVWVVKQDRYKFIFESFVEAAEYQSGCFEDDELPKPSLWILPKWMSRSKFEKLKEFTGY